LSEPPAAQSVARRRGLGVGGRIWIGLDRLLRADHPGRPLPNGDDRLQGLGPVERWRVEGIGVAELDGPRRQCGGGAQFRCQVEPGVLDQAAQVVDVVLALERNVARDKDGLDRLLNRLLRELCELPDYVDIGCGSLCGGGYRSA
jgi:hypothetical protein